MRTAGPLLALIAGALIAGCGSDGNTTGETDPAPVSGPIEFRVSGGIGGISEELKIAPSGRASIASGLRVPVTQEFRLPAGRVATIQDQLEAADIGSLEKPPSSGCADCFEYTVSYGGDSYTADEVSVPPPLRPAIATLTGVVSDYGPQTSGAAAGK